MASCFHPTGHKCAKLLALIGAAGIALFLLFAPSREPKYQGRPLSQWLDILEEPKSTVKQCQQADQAIHQIGTNGLPFLVAWLKPSPTKVRILSALMRLPPGRVRRRFIQWVREEGNTTRMTGALHAFETLGPVAAPAIPQLAQVANNQTQAQRASIAVKALGMIGTNALPALIQIVNNTQAIARSSAILEIPRFGVNAQPALPALVKCLVDPDPDVVYYAELAVDCLSLKPEVSIPASD